MTQENNLEFIKIIFWKHWPDMLSSLKKQEWNGIMNGLGNTTALYTKVESRWFFFLTRNKKAILVTDL